MLKFILMESPITALTAKGLSGLRTLSVYTNLDITNLNLTFEYLLSMIAGTKLVWRTINTDNIRCSQASLNFLIFPVGILDHCNISSPSSSWHSQDNNIPHCQERWWQILSQLNEACLTLNHNNHVCHTHKYFRQCGNGMATRESERNVEFQNHFPVGLVVDNIFTWIALQSLIRLSLSTSVNSLIQTVSPSPQHSSNPLVCI